MSKELLSVARARQQARTGEARRIREAAGISLRHLAEALRVDAGTLSRWETGKASPRKDAAARWESLLSLLESEARRGTKEAVMVQ